MLTTLITVPYELARLPLVVVDNRLADRLSEDSRVRVTLDRAIGTGDKLAGGLLRNSDISQRGIDRLERSEKLREAARLEAEAASRRKAAGETASRGRDRAAEKREAAQDRAASGLSEADAVELRAKNEAAAQARKTAAAKKRAADKRAASRASTAEQRKERAEKTAQATMQIAQGKAKAELDDARETKKAAAETRADAERLGDLAETKRKDRKQG